MLTSNRLVPVFLAFLAAGSLSVPAYAADISGSWASDASVCSKVFVKQGAKISFATDAELYGGGLIIEGKRVTGSFQKCTIKSMHDEGAEIHLVASCSTGVMVQDVRIVVKITGENQMTLSSAAPVKMEVSYVRCTL
jgi:hypothetical protein